MGSLGPVFGPEPRHSDFETHSTSLSPALKYSRRYLGFLMSGPSHRPEIGCASCQCKYQKSQRTNPFCRARRRSMPSVIELGKLIRNPGNCGLLPGRETQKDEGNATHPGRTCFPVVEGWVCISLVLIDAHANSHVNVIQMSTEGLRAKGHGSFDDSACCSQTDVVPQPSINRAEARLKTGVAPPGISCSLRHHSLLCFP
jgi:hypothetical protein